MKFPYRRILNNICRHPRHPHSGGGTYPLPHSLEGGWTQCLTKNKVWKGKKNSNFLVEKPDR